MIFKLGGGNAVTVVCCDFAPAVPILAESSSSYATAGNFSEELGPAEVEGGRKIVETRFMAMVEEMGVGEIPRRRLAPREGFYTGVTPGSGVYRSNKCHSHLAILIGSEESFAG